jgi:hypothetical protein
MFTSRRLLPPRPFSPATPHRERTYHGITSALPNRMKRIFSILGLALSLAVASFAQDAKQDMKAAGQDTKDAAKNAAKGTKKAAKTTGHKVKSGAKHTVNKGAKATEKEAGKVDDKTKHQ